MGGTDVSEITRSVPASLQTLGEEGKTLVARGEYAGAIRTFEQGLRKARQLGSVEGELLFLTYIGNAANARHRFPEALENYSRASDLAETTKNWAMLAVIESNIASMYMAQGAIQEASWAMERTDQALARTGNIPQFASIRLLQAKFHAENDDIRSAIALYREAIDAADKAGDEATLCRALELLGYQQLSNDKINEAAQTLTEDFRRRSLLDPPVPDVTYLNLGLLRLRQGDVDAAGTLVDRAFEAMDDRAPMAQAWVPYLVRARVRLAKGDPSGAFEDMERALARVRTLRLALLPTHSVRAGSRAGLEEIHSTFIDVAARLYFENEDVNVATRAFEVAEQYRAIALRESLEEAAEFREQLPVEYWETLDELNSAEQLLMRGRSDDGREHLDQLKSRLHELEAKVGVGLQASHPMLSVAALRPVDLASLKRALSEDEVLFGFQLGEQSSYLWALTTAGLEWYRLSSGPKIGALAREFRDAVSLSSVSVARERGARLYKVLFGQVSERTLAKPDWILMPDGDLFEIPFAALVSPDDVGRDRFLTESHSIRILPSAAMLLDKPAKAWNGPFLGVGDPIYNAADPRWASEGSSGRGLLPPLIANPTADDGIELNRLVGSASEVKLSAQAFGGAAEPLVLLGKDANVSRLRSALAVRPSVIHLATHVIRPPTRDDDVWIALSRSTAGGPELLGGDTLAGWECRPLLVVMSGCYSGGGAVIPGEGLLGLTRAWIRSGARSVAATLWPATDTHGELLRRMYSYVSYDRPDRITPAKALQLAQIDMLRSDEWGARPSYWASYFIVSRE